MRLQDATYRAVQYTDELNAQYNTDVNPEDVKKVIERVWDFIAGWSDDLQRKAVDAYVFGTYCKLTHKVIPGCKTFALGPKTAEDAFVEALEDAGIDPLKYGNFSALWNTVWTYTKGLDAYSQKKIYELFAENERENNPSVLKSPSPSPSPKARTAKPQPKPSEKPEAQPETTAPAPAPSPSSSTVRYPDPRENAFWQAFWSSVSDVMSEKEAQYAFEEEWYNVKILPDDQVRKLYKELADDIHREKEKAPEVKVKKVQPPPARSPTSSFAGAGSTSAEAGTGDLEFAILENGFLASHAPANVLTPLKRKLAALLHQFSEEKIAVKQGRAPSMYVEHALVEALLYDYGDQLVANGWGPIISGSEAYVIRDLWEQLGMFGNFNEKYDYNQDKLVQVNIEGVERDIPAWQVVVYATLGQLLKYLNIPDKYGWEYFDEVLVQMGQ